MTARIVVSPTTAAYYVELVFSRDLGHYGHAEVETDYSGTYFDEEPADWQIDELIPEGWTELERHISALQPDESEDLEETEYWDSSASWVDDSDLYGDTDLEDMDGSLEGYYA